MPDRLPPPLPRQPSRPDLQAAAEKDRTVTGAENQRRFDRPKRPGTLTGMPAPAAPGSKPPPPPRLPGELAATMPAPRNPLQHKTMRADSPPPLVAASRRTDPPPTIDPPAEEARPSARAAAREPILEAELAKARGEIAELKRQGRVQAEAASPATYPPPVTPPAAPVPVVVQQGVSSETLEAYRKAQTKLMLAVAGLLVAIAAPCALWLTNLSVRNESDTKRTQVQVTEVAKATETTKEKTIDGSKETAITKADLAKFKLYFIAVQRRQGVAIRLPDGVREEDLPKLEFEAPLRRPGVVKPGASLIVQTPP